MSGENTEIEVEVVDPGAPQAEVHVEVPKGEAEKPDGKSEDAAIEALKSQHQAALERERKRAYDAESRARQAEGRSAQVETAAADAHIRRLEAAAELEKQRVADAERIITEAGELQEWKKVASAQTQLADAVWRYNEIQRIRGQFPADGEKKPAEGRVQQHPRQDAAPADPVEAMASQLSSQSADWLRAHPECARDDVMYADMIAAHKRAVRDGKQPDTAEYFAFIEDRLGFGKAAATEPAARAASEEPASRAARPTAAAPANKGAVSQSGGGGSKVQVKLSAEEVKLCKEMGWKPENYARGKIDLKSGTR